MTSSSFHFIPLCSILLISVTCYVQTQTIKTKNVLLQVSKDPQTLQYVTQVRQRTPLISLSLTVDLGGRYLFTDCSNGYVSSTYRFRDCHTAQCRLVRGFFCDTCDGPISQTCHNETCAHFAFSPYGRSRVAGSLASDVVSIASTNGQNPTRVVSVPEFLFYCVDNRFGLLDGLANGVTGIAALGRTEISLATQFASSLDFRKIFAMCLSPSSKGVLIFGEGPYMFLPNVNAASSLTYTPILLNRGEWIEQPSSDYFIGITSIKINGKVVPVNTTLLSFDRFGNGGTKISTVNPYTVLEDSIYDAVVKAFEAEATTSSSTRVAAVAPFEVCYNSNSFVRTRVGPDVPVIDLVLGSEQVSWRIFGANSMVQVTKDVMCLGFVKQQGPVSLWNAITIGGYQLENHLLQFNVAKLMFGFSSSLLSRQTTCANFNFTSSA
ncbi:hypothetical protein OROGR_006396 [Orobanche gracilis]